MIKKLFSIITWLDTPHNYAFSLLSPKKSKKSKHQSWLNFITSKPVFFNLQLLHTYSLLHYPVNLATPYPTPTPPLHHHAIAIAFSYVQRTNNIFLFPITPWLLSLFSSSSASFASSLFSLLPLLFTILTVSNFKFFYYILPFFSFSVFIDCYWLTSCFALFLQITLCILIVGVSQIQLISSILHGFPTGTLPAEQFPLYRNLFTFSTHRRKPFVISPFHLERRTVMWSPICPPAGTSSGRLQCMIITTESRTRRRLMFPLRVMLSFNGGHLGTKLSHAPARIPICFLQFPMMKLMFVFTVLPLTHRLLLLLKLPKLIQLLI